LKIETGPTVKVRHVNKTLSVVCFEVSILPPHSFCDCLRPVARGSGSQREIDQRLSAIHGLLLSLQCFKASLGRLKHHTLILAMYLTKFDRKIASLYRSKSGVNRVQIVGRTGEPEYGRLQLV
jgi:hypothetical protein